MKNKTAAMEMTVGTIVTIVLLMAALVLGLVLVQKVFGVGSNAIDSVDSQIQNEISKVFEEEEGNLVIYPSSREITLRKKDDTPKGFAFAVRNTYTGSQSTPFSYLAYAEDWTRCGSDFSETKANSLLLGAKGSFSLKPGEDTIASRDLVKFILDENSPSCTMIYRLKVCEGTGACTKTSSNEYESMTITVTIK